MEKYSKVKVIGKGSFGSATLIKRRSDGQLLVVKEINMLRMNTKEKEEARHEVRVLQKLQHPNITQFVEKIEKKGMLYIVMEYADGGDLHQKIEAAKRTRGFMKEDLVLHYFAQLCLALDYLHCQHILHRDIKAMNVFLTSGGTVKLGDFGISTVLRNTLGMANTVCGTPYYFSPELCRNKPYNNKSDVWAMGIILYELVTLKHAFDGSSMQQLLQRISKGSFSPLPATVHPGIKEMIFSCLQKDPNKRPTIKQLLLNDVMRDALGKLSSNLDLAQIEQKALREVIPRDPVVDDEAQRVLKAKLAGERAAKAVAPRQPVPPQASAQQPQVPPVGRYGIYEQALEQQRQQQQAQNRQRAPSQQQYHLQPQAVPQYQGNYRGPSPQNNGGQPINVKQAMGDLDNFLKHLGRPTDQIAHEALRREREERQRHNVEQERANEKQRVEKEKAEKMRIWEDRQKKERERLREAAARAKAQQAELDRAMNNHKERMKVAQEKEKERRDELKKQIAAKERRKDGDKHKDKLAQQNRAGAAIAQRAANANPDALQQHRNNLHKQQQQQGVQPNLQPPQVDKVQNWAARQNEKNKQQMEAKKLRKIEEDRLSVVQMDAQAIRAQQMKHKVLDPELEAWVNREIRKTEGVNHHQPHVLKAGGQNNEVRRSIDRMDQVLSEHGELKQQQPPSARNKVPKVIEVPGLRLAANANGPTIRSEPAHPKTTDPTSAALFPPLGGGGPSRRQSEAGVSPTPSPNPVVAEPFMAKPKLGRSTTNDGRDGLSAIAQQQKIQPDVQVQRHMQPGGGHHQQQHPVAGRRMADRRPKANVGRLSLEPTDLKGPNHKALAGHGDPRRGSAPTVMRTPTKYIDAAANSPGTNGLELDAESKFEEIPTPVRQWMDAELPSRVPPQNIGGDKNTSNPSGSSKQSSSNLSGLPPHQNSRTMSPPMGVMGDDEYVDEILVNGEPVPPSARDLRGGGGDQQIIVDEVDTASDFSGEEEEESDGVDLNPIVETAMASPAAAKRQQNEYTLMRSHIQDLLTASQIQKNGGGTDDTDDVNQETFGDEDEFASQQSSAQPTPQESPQQAGKLPVAHVPVTPPPRNPQDPRGPAGRGIRSTSPPPAEESFGDAEPITPVAIRDAVRGRGANAVRRQSNPNGSGASSALSSAINSDEDLEVEEEGGLTAQDSEPTPETGENDIIDDMSETALQRVAAICGEAFTGTQPCHLDGRPVFERSGTASSHAEPLREYLEEVLGIQTLTSVYTIIGELLDPEGGEDPEGDDGGRFSDFAMASYQNQVGGVMKRAVRLVSDRIGEAASSDALIDESITLVAQLVYFDAEAFTS